MVSGATTNSARLKLTLCYDLILSTLGACILKRLGLSQRKSVFRCTNPGFIPCWTIGDDILLLLILLASTTLRFDVLLNKVTFSSE